MQEVFNHDGLGCAIDERRCGIVSNCVIAIDADHESWSFWLLRVHAVEINRLACMFVSCVRPFGNWALAWIRCLPLILGSMPVAKILSATSNM